MPVANQSCRRCSASLVPETVYCPICGVAVAAAATGEWEVYDLERFFNFALDLLCIAGTDGYFKKVNPAFTRTLGYSAEELLARPFTDFVHPDDRTDTVAETGKLSSGAPTLLFENRYLCKDGAYRDLRWTAFPEASTGLLYAVAHDVTELKRRQDQRDGLTGLASMRAFEQTLPQEWSRSRRLGAPLTLALFDLDRFEQFNARCGFETGDRFLVGVSGVLADHARRAGDLAARVGGQKFAQMLQGKFTPGEAVAFCEGIRADVADLVIPNTGPEPLPPVTTIIVLAGGVACLGSGVEHLDAVRVPLSASRSLRSRGPAGSATRRR